MSDARSEGGKDDTSGASLGAVQHYLSGMNYPAKKEAVIKHAKDKSAPNDVLDMLERLPSDVEFAKSTDVNKHLGDN